MKRILLFVMTSFLAAFLLGCQNDNNEQSSPNNQENQPIQVKNSDPRNVEVLDNQEKAQHLANLASEVPEVNGATAIMTNQGALIAIDVDKDLDRSTVGSIKYTVLEAVHHDPQGRNAVVVADGDVFERLNHIMNEVRNGQPVSGFLNELGNLIGRWIPEFPIDEQTEQKTKQNTNRLDSEEEDELGEINKEQSNHHK
ncbi:YhcN/YlaJ family sporulation lipoprotein [Gracilibacillus halotolerans]|uniref:YhcN/YlaJ family sporulation lipoprotein n=1 Tax=Gracilibacillus halotolerans TaxID=74386 RepID=A0A841RFT0_9BACI|nr:YhcN/YlaJ family sporulation lipoprotein [Gracilibacillus halotolerans]MBB6511319.1 YhcN/YlaJ family sporulation lipoprotein [Gracilibacillus halotolerans]